MVLESIRMAWQTLMHRKLRSFLTILGVVIGVTAIIALVSMVNGVMEAISRKFYGLGVGKISITCSGTQAQPGLAREDLIRLRNLPSVTGASPSILSSGSVVIEGKTVAKVSILGKSSDYFRYESPAIRSGRALSPLDGSAQSRVCLINESLERDCFFGKSSLGHSLWLGGQQYRVVGVTGKSRAVDAAFSAGDRTVILPYEALLAMEGTRYLGGVDLYLSDPADAQTVQKQAESLLSGVFRGREDTYTVTTMESLMTVMEELESLMTLLLAGIASISLIVGGIGIMNMMLVSVAERRAEIGLRKALGAPPGGIRLQFLLESVFLSLIGGVLGTAGGVGATLGASALLEVPCAVSFRAILLGVGFSALVGVLFGYAPARNASRLNPIDALRSQ